MCFQTVSTRGAPPPWEPADDVSTAAEFPVCLERETHRLTHAYRQIPPISTNVCALSGHERFLRRPASGVCRLASAVWRPVSAAYNFIDRHELHQNKSFTKQTSKTLNFISKNIVKNFIKQTTLSTCLMTCSLRSLARFARLSGNGASCGHRKSCVERVVCFLCQSRGGCMDHFLFASRVLI